MEKEKKENPVRAFLDHSGMRAYHLAKLAKVAGSAIHNYYHGRCSPSRPTAVRICRATNWKIRLEDFGFN